MGEKFGSIWLHARSGEQRPEESREWGTMAPDGCCDQLSGHPSPVESALGICTLNMLTAGHYCETEVRCPIVR